MQEEVAQIFSLSADAPALLRALTHPSFANELDGEGDNQRLEFLGDAVLGLCVSELLVERFPAADEGALSRMRAKLVNADALATWARDNHIPASLRLGRGAMAGGLADSTNVLADAVEALIAASYLESGLDAARRACRLIAERSIDALSIVERDPKSELQERVQAGGAEAPTYVVVDSGGPSHERWFEVSVQFQGADVARGRGRSKRLAERCAAEEALANSAAWPELPARE